MAKKETSNLLQAGVGASSTVCGRESVVVKVGGGGGGGSDVFQMSAGHLQARTRTAMMMMMTMMMLTLKKRPL